jgi:hypothetical protein
MVRDEISDVSEAVRLEYRTQALVVGFVAEIAVETAMLADVVAVRAAGLGLEVRRVIALGGSQLRQIRHQIPSLGKAEVAIEL